jgi:crotonobetainyl-CoA:carnitine CoA-transferase CaiB-like acyl-CoA transferase
VSKSKAGPEKATEKKAGAKKGSAKKAAKATAAESTMQGVRFLDDVRVLEIASLSPTQFGMHLADLGAEVIKVEPPQRGDATRLIDARAGMNDSALHRRWNRGKRSLALDTRTPEGLELVKRLIPTVDILIEGLRPGTLAKMGLTREVLTELNPRLVMIALSGYGQTGPYRDLPSHGVAFDAISGLAGVEDDEEGRPRVPARHVYYGAIFAPLLAASSALAALSWARRHGKPVFLDIAQADAATFANYVVEEQMAERLAIAAGVIEAPPPPPPSSEPPPRASAIQAYRTRDGKPLMLMALERKFFARLAEATGRQDLMAYAGDGYLVRGSKEIDEALIETIATKDRDEWMEIFAAADVPVVPINDGAAAAENPQLKSRIEWLDADQSTVTMKAPVHSQPAIAAPLRAPAIGQDTADILARIDIGAAELKRLEKDGIIRVAKAAKNAKSVGKDATKPAKAKQIITKRAKELG